jgi:iron complex outermembrane recepter protein
MSRYLAVISLALAWATSAMADELIEMQPLVIESAAWPDRTADDLVEPVEVLSGEELQRRRAGTIGELLGNEPGIGNSSYGPGVGRPVIRGQGGPRVHVLENGIRSMDISTVSPDHAVSISPLNARKVEVIKGPATLLYGSGASAGIVNILNNRMPKFFTSGLSGNADFSMADNGLQRLGSVDATYGWENFALQADFATQYSNDFSIPGTQDIEGEGRRGRLENSSIRNFGGGVSGSWVGQRGYLGMAVSVLDQDYGVPEVIDPGDPEFERILIDQVRYDLRGELYDPLPGFTAARIAFGHNWYNQEEVEFEDGEREVEAEFRNREWDLRMDMMHKPIGPFTGIVGTQFTDRDFRAKDEDGDNIFVPPTQTSSYAVFILEELPMNWGRFEFGGRYERNESDTEDGRSARFNLFSASAGVLFDIDPLHHVSLSYNRAERAPVAEELFSSGRHAATRTFDIGDANLSSEVANEFDLGVDRHGDRWNWRVNLFYNYIQDYIFPELQVDGAGNVIMVDDDGNPDPTGRNQLIHYRQSNAEFYGLEAETRFALVTEQPYTLNLRLFGDIVRGRLTGGDGDLPRVTPARFGASLDGTWRSFDAHLEVVNTFRQNRIGQGETKTDGFTMLGFDLGYTFNAGMDTRARLYLRGRNLLDQKARLHTSFLKDDSPLLGRTIIGGVRVDF